MDKHMLEELINYALGKGADYCDFYFEEKEKRNTQLIDKKINLISINIISGVGIRLIYEGTEYCASTSKMDYDSIKLKIDELSFSFKSKSKPNVKLNDLKIYGEKKQGCNDEKKVLFLKKCDKYARSLSSLIEQFCCNLFESFQEILIVNSNGNYCKEYRYLSRFYAFVYVLNNGMKTSGDFNIGYSTLVDKIIEKDFSNNIKECFDVALKKSQPINLKGGKMPVIIGSGFGGVIIHEAFGHPVEASHLIYDESVLKDKIGLKIANDIVTIIDDGSLVDAWGSTLIDDDGNETKKNILVENGILKTYLVDNATGKHLDMETTSSSRRENYKFSTTTRMNNTYLKSGNDTVEDMIKSIDYGLYAKSFSGGSVNPLTGDFNFTVSEGYLIENGKISGIVKTASLIDNALSTLCKIDMIGNDFDFGCGYCGAKSGSIPVTSSQPTIRVSEILVGGNI